MLDNNISNNNIFLLTNNNNITTSLRKKLVLLRNFDKIVSVSYKDAISTLESALPEIILLYCSNTEEEQRKCLDLIVSLKKNSKTGLISIVLLVENLDQNFILEACDIGIADYIELKSDNEIEIMIRTIWSLKKNAISQKTHKQTELLKKFKFLNSQTDFYSNKYCKEIYDNEISFLKSINTTSMIMLVRLAPESKKLVSLEDFVSAIKMSIRNTDTIIHATNDSFYFLLAGTKLEYAFVILDKIKNNIAKKDIRIQASAINTENKDFDSINEKLLQGLQEVESYGEDLVVFEDETETTPNKEKKKKPEAQPEESTTEQTEDSSADSNENILDVEEISNNEETTIVDKNKDWMNNMDALQRIPKTLIESIILPIFVKMKKHYENSEFTIEYKTSLKLCEFIIKEKEDYLSVIKITYHRLSKMNVDCLYGNANNLKNKKYKFDLSKFSEKILQKIIINVIENYKNQ